MEITQLWQALLSKHHSRPPYRRIGPVRLGGVTGFFIFSHFIIHLPLHNQSKATVLFEETPKASNEQGTTKCLMIHSLFSSK